jgi:hypothetical protein
MTCGRDKASLVCHDEGVHKNRPGLAVLVGMDRVADCQDRFFARRFSFGGG